MITSGKCATLVSDNDLSDDKGDMQDLPEDVHALFVEMYKTNIPRYSKGPDKCICICKKLLLKDENTGRLITYAADKDESHYP